MMIDAERMERNRRYMAENDIEAFVCQLPENVVFLSGWWPLTERRMRYLRSRVLVTWWRRLAKVVRRAGTILLICRPMNGRTLMPGIRLGKYDSCWHGQGRSWASARVGSAIEATCGAVAPPLNVAEPAVPTQASREMLQEVFPKAVLFDATESLNRLRVTKTGAEIEKLRIVNEIAGYGLAAFVEGVAVGVSEIELAAAANSAVMVKGSGYKGVRSVRGFAQVSSAGGTERAWRPTVLTTNRQLQNGDIVLLEFGVVADGLWADLTRVTVVGEAN